MEPTALVKQAIDSLSPFLPQVAGTLSGLGEAALAARSLYEIVADVLHRHDEDEALREFVANPANNYLVKRVLVQAVETDADLREQLTRALSAVTPAVSTNVVNQSGSVVAGHQVGRDMVNDQSTTHHNQTTTNKRSSNLPLIIALVIGAIVACLVGKALLASAGGGLNGSSTCRDYLASSDTGEKVSVMKSLYLNANKPQLAADPFIVQNTEYFCGNSPDTTLSQLVAARRN